MGWVGGCPAARTKVIVKSTHEAWSVGVTDKSVFIVDESLDHRVSEIAETIGQSVTVQEFIPGLEVYVPVLSCPELIALPPMESILDRAPGEVDAVVTIDDNLRDHAITYRRFDASVEIIDRLYNSALKIFSGLELQGFARIDFRVDGDNQPWVFDIAISPGLEDDGSGFGSIVECGFDYPSFLRLVIAATLGSVGLLNP